MKLSAGVEAAHLNILALGYATRMLRLPLGQASIFEIPLEAPPPEQCSRGALAPLGELV